MASTTTNLGLMKPAYSDDADISDINGNMDLIDAEAGRVRANVAANYDSSETYAVGDYCLHDGSLYKCSTTISSPEAWTAGHWTQIKITGELATLNDNIATLENKVNAFSNRTLLLNATTEGQHTLDDLLTNYRYVLMILRDTVYSACHGSNFIPVGLFKEYSSSNFACGISAYNNGRIYTYVNYVSGNNKVNVQLSSGYGVLIYGIK